MKFHFDFCVLGLALVFAFGCASNRLLPGRPSSAEITKINAAATNRWVVVTCTDNQEFEGTFYSMTDSTVELLGGGSRFAEQAGNDHVYVPVPIVTRIDIQHASVTKPLAYLAGGVVLGLLLGAQGDTSTAIVGGLLMGTAVGAVVGVGYFLFWTLPDLLTDRPTFILRNVSDAQPIQVDTILSR